MDNLIRVFNDVLDKERCNYMINKFEDNPKLHYNFDYRGMVFTQINLRGVDWAEEEHFFFEIFKNCVGRYIEDCKITKNQWPTDYEYEPVRMKRYLPNNYDEFKNHVDVDRKVNSTRFLVMFLYLADNEKGKTMFPNLDIEIECKQGSLLMFPPMWPWLHAGQKPARTSKYIMQSYLHYV